ncbi:MAG: hypothetical protein PHR35_02175 [Kiritimatiellae bacterium]|nr:hypothetical protein [Kiritimatiellia bacterium]
MKGVLLLYNEPEATAVSPMPAAAGAWAESDAGVMHALRQVGAALDELGERWRAAGISSLTGLPALLRESDADLVFNLVERLPGGSHVCAYVPAVCEAFGRACVGGDTRALLLTLDKALTKARLIEHGIGVAPGVVVPVGAPLPAWLPDAPLFVKPLAMDGSEGIAPASLVRDPATQLAAAVARVHGECGQPALVESYIDGREVNLAVMEVEGEPRPLPVAEIDFSLFPPGRAHVVDYDLKWHPGTIPGHLSPRKIPAVLGPGLNAQLPDLARQVWHACGCRDYARIDCRVDRDGNVHVLEVNINCDLSPLAGFSQALEAAGIAFTRFVAQMLTNARARTGTRALWQG